MTVRNIYMVSKSMNLDEITRGVRDSQDRKKNKIKNRPPEHFGIDTSNKRRT